MAQVKAEVNTGERKAPTGNSEKRRRYDGHDVDGLSDEFEGIGSGIYKELKRRCPYYLSDIVDGLTLKSISSSLAMFFATYFATMSLATHIQEATNHRIGMTEYIYINSIAGMLHSLFGAQPLLILRPTESTTLMIIFLSKTADMFQFDFYQLLAATGYFLGVNLLLISFTEASRFLRYVTRFTYELFIAFICSLYIYDGIGDILGDFRTSGADEEEKTAEWGNSLFMACLAVMTFGIAIIFHFAIYWVIFSKEVRNLIADYALAIAVITSTAFSFAFKVASQQVERVDLPNNFNPSCAHLLSHESQYYTQRCIPENSGYETTPRAWLVNFDNLTTINLWILAFLCSLPISFFFFMDQNVAALLSQQPQTKLRKGAYYHVSFLILGAFNLVGPSFGLPFITGSSPHSQQFVKYLTTFNSDYSVRYVNENRVAPFIIYALVGLSMKFPNLLELVPLGTIRGVLTFIGVVGLINTQLWDRVLCLFRAPEDFVEKYNKRGVAGFRVHLYTILQILIFAACWVINVTPGGIFVAFLIAILAPIRIFLLPFIFTEVELVVLENNDLTEIYKSKGGGQRRAPRDLEAKLDDNSGHSNNTDASALPLMSLSSTHGKPSLESLAYNANNDDDINKGSSNSNSNSNSNLTPLPAIVMSSSPAPIKPSPQPTPVTKTSVVPLPTLKTMTPTNASSSSSSSSSETTRDFLTSEVDTVNHFASPPFPSTTSSDFNDKSNTPSVAASDFADFAPSPVPVVPTPPPVVAVAVAVPVEIGKSPDKIYSPDKDGQQVNAVSNSNNANEAVIASANGNNTENVVTDSTKDVSTTSNTDQTQEKSSVEGSNKKESVSNTSSTPPTTTAPVPAPAPATLELVPVPLPASGPAPLSTSSASSGPKPFDPSVRPIALLPPQPGSTSFTGGLASSGPPMMSFAPRTPMRPASNPLISPPRPLAEINASITSNPPRMPAPGAATSTTGVMPVPLPLPIKPVGLGLTSPIAAPPPSMMGPGRPMITPLARPSLPPGALPQVRSTTALTEPANATSGSKVEQQAPLLSSATARPRPFMTPVPRPGAPPGSPGASAPAPTVPVRPLALPLGSVAPRGQPVVPTTGRGTTITTATPAATSPRGPPPSAAGVAVPSVAGKNIIPFAGAGPPRGSPSAPGSASPRGPPSPGPIPQVPRISSLTSIGAPGPPPSPVAVPRIQSLTSMGGNTVPSPAAKPVTGVPRIPSSSSLLAPAPNTTTAVPRVPSSGSLGMTGIPRIPSQTAVTSSNTRPASPSPKTSEQSTSSVTEKSDSSS